MKKIILSFCSILIISQINYAQTQVQPVVSGTLSTKELMQQFLSELLSMRKYMVSDKRFADPKNESEISSHLKQMAKLSAEASHTPMLSLENFKMSREVLVNHMAETERVYETGNKSFARWMLNSTIYVCMSCHTQLPAVTTAKLQMKDDGSYFSEFEQAEFLFAARSFQDALRLYENVIEKSTEENFDVDRSLERIVIYYSRISRDAKTAIEKLEKYRLIKKMPQGLRTLLIEWIAQFKVFEAMDFSGVSAWSNKDVLKFARKNLQNKKQPFNLVTYAWVSGVLYEYLQVHSESESVPEMLYWLAISDNQMTNNVFFSLAQMYLQECVNKAPKKAIAQKCYREYEEEVTASYSGTRGTDIPADVKKDLNDLKKKAYGK